MPAWLYPRRLSVFSNEAICCSVSGLRSTSRNYHAIQSIACILDSAKSSAESSTKPVEKVAHVRTIRNQKHLSFAKLGDGSTTEELQVIMKPSQAKGLCTGAAVRVTGRMQPSPLGLEQTHELHADKVEILGCADPETSPLQKKFHTHEFLRTIPHLRLRIPFNALLTRLGSDCDAHISTFLSERNFSRIRPPIITSSDCEGAGEVFSVIPQDKGEGDSDHEDFFGIPKYLTVSSQLHLEALAHEHEAVWSLSPTFRAERSDTPRHMSEFYMLEAELRTSSLDDVMNLVEELVHHLATKIQSSRTGHELFTYSPRHESGAEINPSSNRRQLLESRYTGLLASPWPRITYTDAISLLQSAVASSNASFVHSPTWSAGLQLEHEKYLASTVGKGSPVFVVHYPSHLKPFYMLPSPSPSGSGNNPTTEHSRPPDGTEGKTVQNFDLLFPSLAEVAGGSLRQHNLEPLLASMAQHGLSTAKGNSLEWYLDLRRLGSVPHGGFGLGFDRLLCYLSGVENVKDVVGWPRWVGRCDG